MIMIAGWGCTNHKPIMIMERERLSVATTGLPETTHNRID
jgi:hypothetical protein